VTAARGGERRSVDHRLAEPLRCDEHDVSGLFAEVEAKIGLDQGAIDFLRPVPVEVRNGFEALEGASTKSSLKAALSAVFLFEFRNMLKELDGTEALLGGERYEVVESVGCGGETESAKQRSKITLGHGITCFSAGSERSESRS
jgi:hypothetical protein